MDENHDCMLEKLDLILSLIRDCNFTLDRILSRDGIRYTGSISSDGVSKPEDVKETEPKSEAELEPEPDILELEPNLETINEPNPESKLKEFLVEAHVDIPTEPILKLLPSSPAVRVLLSLRPPNVYDPLQIFLKEACSQVFGISVCDAIFIRVDLRCFAAFILLELLLTVADLSGKPVSPPPLWLRLDVSVSLSRPPPCPD